MNSCKGAGKEGLASAGLRNAGAYIACPSLDAARSEPIMVTFCMPPCRGCNSLDLIGGICGDLSAWGGSAWGSDA